MMGGERVSDVGQKMPRRDGDGHRYNGGVHLGEALASRRGDGLNSSAAQATPVPPWFVNETHDWALEERMRASMDLMARGINPARQAQRAQVSACERCGGRERGRWTTEVTERAADAVWRKGQVRGEAGRE